MSSLKAWLKTHTDIKYEEIEKKNKIGKIAGGWLTGEVVKNLKEKKLTFKSSKMLEKDFAALLGMIISKKITSNIGQTLLENMVAREIDPEELMNEMDITVMNDDSSLNDIITSVLTKNSSVVEQYKNGKTESLQFLIGMVMRESKGAADPEKTKDLLISKMK